MGYAYKLLLWPYNKLTDQVINFSLSILVECMLGRLVFSILAILVVLLTFTQQLKISNAKCIMLLQYTSFSSQMSGTNEKNKLFRFSPIFCM
jgi:hypothetical protein